MKRWFQRLIALALLTLLPNQAFAVCANPAGAEGELIYNSTHKVLQFCNGTLWIATGGQITEVDPKVGTLTATKWCTANAGGTAIDCTEDEPMPNLSCADQESPKFEGGAWVCAEITDFPAPPICIGASAALQWDGTSWDCVTVVGGSGGGPTIVNGDHTQQECIDAGGTINTSDFGGDIVCLFSGTTCPSGWTSYGQWYRTSKTCTGNTSCLPATGRDCTLPAGWVTSIGARSCTYKPSYPTCNGSCSQASGVGVTTVACY